MEIVTPGPQPDPRQQWEESSRRSELLALLRNVPGGVSAIAPALRTFATRCVRQGGGDALVDNLAHELEQLDMTSDPSAELAVLRARSVAAADAAVRELAASTRRVAARRLAAFNALLDDPYDAAVGASKFLLRYGASDALEERAMREEQVQWLRELLGNPFPFVDPSATRPRIDRPWEESGLAGRDLAGYVRALRHHGAELVARDPWIPVPQRSCNYGFGFDSRPFPIGALAHLWEHWPAMSGGRCPVCGGEVWGYSIGGMLSNGGVLGCCLVCERELRRPIGGLVTVAECVEPILAHTPYRLEVVGMPGAYPGEVEPLLDALAALEVERVIS